MKVKTSITLSEELLIDLDLRAGALKKNRSEFIESAVASFIQRLDREQEKSRDVEIISSNADELNAEARDVLEYQIVP